ncbi:CotH kinase family protein [Bacteroidales bacterium OttesenSCG-928-J19]|nr:CotH kinase family protein [Bacteroidales bacterium OttesenSCG-928-J19]
MKLRTVFLFALFFILFATHPAFAFDANEEYRITCYTVSTGGVEAAETGTYPLMHNNSANKTTDRAFWSFKEEENGKYSIRNVATNQYIKYLANHYETRQIQLVNTLDTQDKTTLFTIEPVIKNSVTYYVIRSVADTKHIFNLRVNTNVVGTYLCEGRNVFDNELFTIKTRSSLPDEMLQGGTKLSTYLDSIKFDNKDLSYCSNYKTYFYSIPLEQMNTDISLPVTFIPKNKAYGIRIETQNITNGTSFTFEKVEANKQYKIEVLQNGTVVATNYVIFTGLPIVQLYSNGNSLSTTFSQGKICVHDSENLDSYELLNVEMRYRGAITLNYQKKSFALKIKDENWVNLDKRYFGLREDKYWILDAAAIDKSRMRNRVCADMWNDFAVDLQYKPEEPEMINGTRGQFVELFLDDQYWGLYCMSERVDRKQLKLKKFKEDTRQVRGLLYKTSDWSYSVMMGYRPDNGVNTSYPLAGYSNTSVSWDKHEAKYPDPEDGEPFDWKPLYDIVKLVAHGSDNDFKNKITQYIDMPVWADYYLLMEFIMATDNHGKNAYMHFYNISESQVLGITPWDMDAVLGRRWNANAVDAMQDYTSYIRSSEHGEHNLFRRLKLNNIGGFNDILKKRYDELRFTYLLPENVLQRFKNYQETFDIAGASTREAKRWSGTNGIEVDFEKELSYLNIWLKNRALYLDKQYGDPIPNNLDEIGRSEFSVFPNPVVDKLQISNVPVGSRVQVYSLQGVCLNQVKAEETRVLIDFSTFPSGLYLVKIDGNEGRLIIKK